MADCDIYGHTAVRTYRRVWWAPWRKIIVRRCWVCGWSQRETGDIRVL